jgi:hypothetical protein
VRQCSRLIGALLLAALAADVAGAEPDEVVDLPPGRAFPAIDELRIGAMEPVDGPHQDKNGPTILISNSCLVGLARNIKMHYGIISFGHGCISAVPSAPMAAQTLPMQV